MGTVADTSGDTHLAAIFVHAGAGYHSTVNEHFHLKACAKAAQIGMLILKNGGTCVDAAEMAVRCLEDNEITNAGLGSNLTMDRTVECDATIVDHLGRSGAVGAMPHVRNPISVARLVYEESTKPMVLRRVPPNLLTGRGATIFANEQGMEIVSNNELITEGSKMRYERWKKEIDIAYRIETKSHTPDSRRTATPDTEVESIQEAIRHGPALSNDPCIAALGNESQPFSPASNKVSSIRQARETPVKPANVCTSEPQILGSGQSPDSAQSHHKAQGPGAESTRLHTSDFDGARDYAPTNAMLSPLVTSNEKRSRSRGPCEDCGRGDGRRSAVCKKRHPGPILFSRQHNTQSHSISKDGSWGNAIIEDDIVDTVGAIAIDKHGHVAAASSSGGIGMKHCGRTGPAALVGVGSSVIPVDPNDQDATAVACVTSGTGEHMSSTMAAQTCAQRMYTNTKLDNSGSLVDTNEDDAMQAFVNRDFMAHPAVQASHSGGAIGAMVVKKTRDGLWMYWVHNTDSFALACMHAGDEVPHTSMSRNRKAGMVATGARSMRLGGRRNKASSLESDKARLRKQGKRRVPSPGSARSLSVAPPKTPSPRPLSKD